MNQIAETIDSIENSAKCNNTPSYLSNTYTPFSANKASIDDSTSDSDDEQIAISQLSSIIKDNNNTIQRLQMKLVDKQSKIPKITAKLTQLNSQLKEEVKSMNVLITTFDTPLNVDSTNENYSLIVNVINDIIAQANNHHSIDLLSTRKENINSIIKEIRNDIQKIPIEERRMIKQSLLEIRDRMKKNGSFYSYLYEMIICEYDIVSVNDKITKGEDALKKTKKTIEDIKAQIEKLEHKNSLFDQTKGVIKKKYYKNRSDSNDKVENENKEIKASVHQEEIDKLKLLIYNMDKNYIELLKQLSLKIVKPKDLFAKQK